MTALQAFMLVLMPSMLLFALLLCKPAFRRRLAPKEDNPDLNSRRTEPFTESKQAQLMRKNRHAAMAEPALGLASGLPRELAGAILSAPIAPSSSSIGEAD
jgi:hypothetical protein